MSYAFRTEGGVEEDDPRAEVLWDYGCQGIWQDDGYLVGYFSAPVDLPLEGCWEELPDIDYLETFTRNLRPVIIGTMVIAPTHARVQLEAGQKVLWLDPGMAFGTGHHETTRLALQALERRELLGTTVWDVGSGSGILAVAADLLGAKRVQGIDSDETTIAVARDNARRNRSRALFRCASLYDEQVAGAADIIVANLYAELHLELMDQYLKVLRPGGYLLITGIIGSKVELVQEHLPARLTFCRSYREGEWALLEARKASHS